MTPTGTTVVMRFDSEQFRFGPRTHQPDCGKVMQVGLGCPMFNMRRRDVIALLGSTAATWPIGARAQQAGDMRRIGVLLNRGADDPEAQARLKAFVQGL